MVGAPAVGELATSSSERRALLRVFVTVGTDHHPFDRVVNWIDDAARAHPEAHFLVQYGSSRAPVYCEGEPNMTSDAMRDAIRNADVVVCHGGPATIAEARESGRLPIVIPRRSALGEHVDDHQVRFTAFLASLGRVHSPADQQEFDEMLAASLADPRRGGAADEGAEVERTVQLLGDLIDAMIR
jgi:UDP-N-acetylglucosamine transferase subunit ALG13